MLKTQALADFLKTPETDNHFQTLSVAAALQQAFTVVQTILTLLQTEGPEAFVQLPFPKEWSDLLKAADEFSRTHSLARSPRRYEGATVNGFTKAALSHAYHQIEARSSTYVLH